MALLKKIFQYTIPITCILGALLFSFLISLTIGFFSTDYVYVNAAANLLEGRGGGLFKPLYFSPLMDYLWMLTAEGQFNEIHWHTFALLSQILNALIIFAFGRYRLQLSLPTTLSLVALILMNPLGVEVLAWPSALGYMLTLNWILISLFIFDIQQRFLSSVLLFVSGVLGVLTWQWIVLAPVILICYGIGKKDDAKSIFIKLAPMTLFLGLFCYSQFIPLYMDQFSIKSWGRVFAHFVSSPVAGLFPNLNQEDYRSWFGYLLVVLVYAAFFTQKDRIAASFLIASVFCAIPWAFASEMHAAYLYLAIPPLYIAVIRLLNHYEDTHFLSLILPFLLVFQFMWMSERGLIWMKAFDEAQSLKDELVQQYSTEKVILLGLPRTYGPSWMVMKPQFWPSGIELFLPNAIFEIQQNSDAPILRIEPQSQEKWEKFEIIYDQN